MSQETQQFEEKFCVIHDILISLAYTANKTFCIGCFNPGMPRCSTMLTCRRVIFRLRCYLKRILTV